MSVTDQPQRAQNVPVQRVRELQKSNDAADLGQVCEEMTQIVAGYARRRPEVMAMVCVGIGFVLGWKLKPW
jgi:hypothetical protein